MRAGDAELLHSKLERWAFHPEFSGGSVRASEDPVGLLQDGQNVSSFNVLKGSGSVCLAVGIGGLRFQVGQGDFEDRAFREDDGSLDNIL